MPDTWLVTKVKLRDDGDVDEVEWGRADGSNRWHEGWPQRADVIKVVDELVDGERVELRTSDGAPASLLRVVQSKRNEGIETIARTDGKDFSDISRLT